MQNENKVDVCKPTKQRTIICSMFGRKKIKGKYSYFCKPTKQHTIIASCFKGSENKGKHLSLETNKATHNYCNMF